MEDQWAAQLYEASFGGVRLDVLSLQDDLSRALARYLYPHRDGADLEDMGAESRVTNCQLIFFPRDGQNAKAAFDDFQEVVNRGKPEVFVHPLFGASKRRVGRQGAAISQSQRDSIIVDVEFVEDRGQPPFVFAGSGAPVASSVDEVTAISAELDEGLVDVNEREGLEGDDQLFTTAGAEAVAAVTAWDDPDSGLTERDVRYAAATLANKISVETDRLELALHVERIPLAQSFASLHYAVRRAADAFIVRSTPRLFDITVMAPRPLIVIAAETYGAEECFDRYDELLELNDIRNPNRIDRGTVLKAQVPGRTGEARTRGSRGRAA